MRRQSLRRLALLFSLVIGVVGVAGWQPQVDPESFVCAPTDVPHAECQALVDLYNATGGPDWTYEGYWLRSQQICDWAGVDCEERQGKQHVVKLSLNDNNLVGHLPGTLSGLSWLEALFLAKGAINGSIPSELSALTRLSNLNLGYNELSGEIPEELAELPDLTWLNLENNSLSGKLPEALMGANCAGCPVSGKYGMLRLSNNEFEGELPESIGRLDISTLDFRYNPGLEGPIPHSYIHLRNVGVFFYFQTNVCTPADPGILTWLDSVNSVLASGLDCADAEYEISGRILGSVGQPLDHVWVATDANHGTYTDALGRFQFEAPSGTHTVTPELPDYTFVPDKREVTLPPDASDINFTGYAGLMIVGRVTDESGQPLAGIMVFTQHMDGGITDANGDYVIDLLDPGNYQVEATDPAYKFEPATKDVSLPPSVRDVDFVASPLPYGVGVTPMGEGWDVNQDPEIAGILADLVPGDTLGFSCPQAATTTVECEFSGALISLQADSADWKCDLVRLRPLSTSANNDFPASYRAWIELTTPLNTGTCPPLTPSKRLDHQATRLTFVAGSEAFMYSVNDGRLILQIESTTTDILSEGNNVFSVEQLLGKTIISVYGGRVRLTPANSSLAPVDLEQGQRVSVTSDEILDLSPLRQVYLPQVIAKP